MTDLRGLSPRALRQLGRVVAAARRERRSLVIPDIVEAVGQLGTSGRLTIDLRAVEILGFPLVVLEPPRWSLASAELSLREREVAALVAEGLGNQQIARRLGITVGTVKHHVHRILVKTRLPSRTALAASIHR